MKTNRLLLLFLICILGVGPLPAQEKAKIYDLFETAEKKKLEVFNREVSTFSESGKKGIRFSASQGDGIAWLSGTEFSNGTIEVDIRGKDLMQQSFVGIAFHGLDNTTFDGIYFRPFNFRSTDPVRKIHAVQYISHPENTWQVLREKHNGIYEKAVNPAPDGNDWFHARILVRHPEVFVYVNGSNEPSLAVKQLSSTKKGKIGLWVGNGSGGDFANLVITGQD